MGSGAMERAFLFHEWMDMAQSLAMIVIVITQVTILVFMRSEMRRAASTVSIMSRAMGESSDLSRRVEQLEDDVAELAMRSDQSPTNTWQRPQ
jgi:uncharacterized protein YoxC